jgi:DNA-binding response OmpR family regulator
VQIDAAQRVPFRDGTATIGPAGRDAEEASLHLLVVEDDARLSRLLRRLLTQDRHVVETALTAEEGLEIATSGVDLDAVVLDVGLPDRSGFEVARELRRKGSQVPILMLTARDSVNDRVTGLDAGADDYLVKPFAYEELLARLRALGRRPPARKSMSLRSGPFELDEVTRRVTVGGRSIDLSQREFSIMECLLRRPGQVMSRDQLLDYAWPYGVALTPNTVEAYIHLLREKVGGEAAGYIETVRGVGYRLREA